MKKTILHITEQLGIGGTEVLLKNTVPLLKEYNHIICYLGGEDDLKSDLGTYPLFCLDHHSKKDVLRSVSGLRKILRENKVDLIHAHLFWPTLIARLAKPRRVKLLSSIHSVLSKDAFEKNRMSLWFERLTANKQDALIAVSQYALNDYLCHVRFRKCTHVLYNFVQDDFWNRTVMQKQSSSLSDKLNCVAIGNLKAVKNYPYILKAFTSLNTLPVTLTVYGEGSEREQLQRTINAGKIAVQLKGTNTNLQELLPQYDLFVQMSLYEGFGIALVEAMACGVVPILSDIPVHREVAGDCAFYVDLNNPMELADTLQKLLYDRELYLRQREMCMRRARKIASKEHYLEKLRKIYTGLLD